MLKWQQETSNDIAHSFWNTIFLKVLALLHMKLNLIKKYHQSSYFSIQSWYIVILV